MSDLREIIDSMQKQLEERQKGSTVLLDENLQLAREIVAKKRELEKEEIEEAAVQAEKRKIQKLVEWCELGSRFQKRTFETWDKSRFRRAFEACERFTAKFPDVNGMGLYLYGNVGTGKTHLAAAITNRIIREKVIRVAFVGHITLLNKIRQSYRSNEDAVGIYKEVPLLIIDDLGKSKVTDWSNEVLFDIINYRYEHELPVVITSNFRIDQIAEMVGEAIASRISEMCYPVEMIGNDMRIGG